MICKIPSVNQLQRQRKHMQINASQHFTLKLVPFLFHCTLYLLQNKTAPQKQSVFKGLLYHFKASSECVQVFCSVHLK